MKTDKELLELAAKAAGMPVLMPSKDGEDFLKSYDCAWNPLEDDGDAFRLAVKLNLAVDVSETWVNVFYENKVKVACPIIVSEKTEMTRRAIVRAAAAVGEKL